MAGPRLKAVMVTAYVHPSTHRRMKRVAGTNYRLTLSRQLSDGIESTISELERRVGLKPLSKRT